MKRFAVVGDPIAHSLSPRMHAAAYTALGLPHRYDALQITAAQLGAVVRDLREGRLDGCNVTLPHKVRVLDHVDAVASSAATFGVANTLVRNRRGAVVAHNTDIPALAQELESLGFDRRGTAIVVGSGGAARGAIAALCMLRASRVIVRARTAPRLPDGIQVGFESLVAGTVEREVSVVVQATSLGLDPAGPDSSLPARSIAWDLLPASAVAIDLVYSPPTTPFLESATRAQLRCANGLGMLARQGALAFELWLGIHAPLYTMWQALR